jgi:hypothetical protein
MTITPLAETCNELAELLDEYASGRVAFRDFTDLPSLYLHALVRLGERNIRLCEWSSDVEEAADEVTRFGDLKRRAEEVAGGA